MIKITNPPIDHVYLQFPGGEPHIKLTLDGMTSPIVGIRANLKDFNDLGHLLALTSAIRSRMNYPITLSIPYFPGARQDRQEYGTPFTCKIYADIINAQNYAVVNVYDPHSDMVGALVKNIIISPPFKEIKEFLRKQNIMYLTGLICPDSGAEKRTYKLAQLLKCNKIIFGRKHRNPQTGLLEDFSLSEPLEEKGTYLLADDICDGGGTFVGLAQHFGNVKPLLWVSHGIFSKGYDELFKYFSKIGTTDSVDIAVGNGYATEQRIKAGDLYRFPIA